METDAMAEAMDQYLSLDKHAMKPGGGKRVAGDCSRRRRFCFATNPAKAAFYAAHRSRRFARRFMKAEPTPFPGDTMRSA